ncbi:MAG: hypothetical protein AAFR45_00565 [Pseudomonadota bacterium]
MPILTGMEIVTIILVLLIVAGFGVTIWERRRGRTFLKHDHSLDTRRDPHVSAEIERAKERAFHDSHRASLHSSDPHQ